MYILYKIYFGYINSWCSPPVSLYIYIYINIFFGGGENQTKRKYMDNFEGFRDLIMYRPFFLDPTPPIGEKNHPNATLASS